MTWDWKEQLDFSVLNEALQDVFNGRNVPSITDAQFDGDSSAAVISSEPIEVEQAKKIYHRYAGLEDDKNPHNKVIEIETKPKAAPGK